MCMCVCATVFVLYLQLYMYMCGCMQYIELSHLGTKKRSSVCVATTTNMVKNFYCCCRCILLLLSISAKNIKFYMKFFISVLLQLVALFYVIFTFCITTVFLTYIKHIHINTYICICLCMLFVRVFVNYATMRNDFCIEF